MKKFKSFGFVMFRFWVEYKKYLFSEEFLNYIFIMSSDMIFMFVRFELVSSY